MTGCGTKIENAYDTYSTDYINGYSGSNYFASNLCVKIDIICDAKVGRKIITAEVIILRPTFASQMMSILVRTICSLQKPQREPEPLI